MLLALSAGCLIQNRFYFSHGAGSRCFQKRLSRQCHLPALLSAGGCIFLDISSAVEKKAPELGRCPAAARYPLSSLSASLNAVVRLHGHYPPLPARPGADCHVRKI